MKNYQAIIFDLDGTLWETKESYLASYHYLIKKYPNIYPHFADDTVLTTMGDTFDEVGNKLFPHETLSQRQNLMYEGLTYSCQYILNQPNNLVARLHETLSFLSQHAKLFIVSNCPKPYLDTFFEVSNTKDLITDYRFLSTTFDKQSHIKNLIEEYCLTNILMVGDADDDYLSVNVNKDIDFAYASYGYKTASYYDYYLKQFSDLIEIITFVNYRHQVLKKVDDYRYFHFFDASVVLMPNPTLQDSDYIFGFWRFSEHLEYNQKVFESLEKAIPQNKTLSGPIDYNTWFKYRLALDEFAFVLYPDIQNTLKEVTFLKNLGYQIQFTYTSTLAEIDFTLWKLAKKKRNNDYQVIKVSGNDAYNYLDAIYEISVDCFDKGFYYSPITIQEFKTIYMATFMHICPELIIIYNGSEPIAFSFCYSANGLYFSKTAGIKKNYQRQGLILTLIDESYTLMKANGYNQVVYHFQNEQKNELSRLWRKHCLKQKHYGVFIKEF